MSYRDSTNPLGTVAFGGLQALFYFSPLKNKKRKNKNVLVIAVAFIAVSIVNAKVNYFVLQD